MKRSIFVWLPGLRAAAGVVLTRLVTPYLNCPSLKASNSVPGAFWTQ